MKVIDSKKVLDETKKITKTVKVNEVVLGLIKSTQEAKKNKVINIDDETFNGIITYLALNLIAKVSTKKEYEQIFQKCLVEDTRDCQA